MKFVIAQLPSDSWHDYRSVRLEALKQDPLAFGRTHEEELQLTEGEWRERISHVWFALVDDKVVGMIGLLRDVGLPGEHRGHLISFWVEPAVRGQGIGKKLILYLQKHAHHVGIRKLYLHVTTTQESAIQLYEAVGFVKVGLLKENTRYGDAFYDQYLMEWLAS